MAKHLAAFLAGAVALAAAATADAQVYPTDPCHDGRYSDGRPRSCGELLRWLDRRELYEPPPMPLPHPCTDGRFNDGRARSCDELLRHLNRQRHGWPWWAPP